MNAAPQRTARDILDTPAMRAAGVFGAAVVGVTACVFVAAQIASQEEWEAIGILLLVSAPFVGLPIVSWRDQHTKVLEQSFALAARSRAPNEPWRWQSRWKDGRLRHSTGRTVRWLWVVAAVTAPYILARAARALAVPEDGVIAPMLTVGVWLSWVAWASYRTAAVLRYGRLTLELLEMPVEPGRVTTARLHTPGVAAGAWIHFKLECVEIEKRDEANLLHNASALKSRASRRFHERHSLWAHEAAAQCSLLGGAPRAWTGATLELEIPPTLPETASAVDRDIVWTLDAWANIPGVNFRTQFTLPVFKRRR